jgi:shikimate kinase
MKTHFLLIGFSCTGKTSIGKEVFGKEVRDSDDELLDWIAKEKKKNFHHVYEIYMKLGRDDANLLIQEAEEALISRWASDTNPRIISLGPGFPLRHNWKQLREISYVVLFRRSSQGIYNSMSKRREDIFNLCPEAKQHDNWDVDVIVDEHKKEYSKEEAINRIQKLLDEREIYYRDSDAEIVTDNALQKLRELKSAFGSGRSTERHS